MGCIAGGDTQNLLRQNDSVKNPPMVRVYVAGPLGFTASGAMYLAEVVLPALREVGFEPLDPWTLPSEIGAILALPEGNPRRAARLAEVNAYIGRRNAEMIETCDAVLAFLDGPDVDSGTAAEIGYASALRKRVIGLRSDFRKSGDNEAAVVNLQVEWFIIKSGGCIETVLDVAIERLSD